MDAQALSQAADFFAHPFRDTVSGSDGRASVVGGLLARHDLGKMGKKPELCFTFLQLFFFFLSAAVSFRSFVRSSIHLTTHTKAFVDTVRQNSSSLLLQHFPTALQQQQQPQQAQQKSPYRPT